MSEHAFVSRLCAVLDPLPNAAQETVGQAAVLLALTYEAEPHLYLIRRSLQMVLHPGQMAFPGGKGEVEDPHLLETALREAEEEVAMPRSQVIPCGALSQRRTMTGYCVTPIVAVVPAGLVLAADADEVAEILCIPLSAFASNKNLYIDTAWRAGQKRILARYQIGSAMIWGMTASFIVELVNRFYGSGLDPMLYAPPHFAQIQVSAQIPFIEGEKS